MKQVMEVLCGELEKKLSNQDEGIQSARAMAREIHQTMAISNLEESMSKVFLEREDSTPEIDDGVLPIYLHLLDKSMSMQGTKNDEETAALFMDLVAALSVLSGVSVARALIQRTILYSKAILERVRKRATAFIGYLVAHVSEELGEDSGDLISMMEDAVMMRLKDKCKGVRVCAIEASAPFFDAKYQSENFLHSVLWSLWHDPSAASRSAAVKALPLNKMTIEHVVQRIRDSEKCVRVSSLQALTTSLDSVSLMSPDIFAQIIRSGFSDRCKATKEAMFSLVLCNWIEFLDYDLLRLLRQVDVLSNEEECGVLIAEIMGLLEACNEETPYYLSGANIQGLKASFVRQKKLFAQSIDLKKSAAPEETFLFRLAYCKGVESPEMLSPENYKICSSLDTSELCDRIVRYSSSLQDALEEENQYRQEECAFHCFQLVDIARFVSFTEEGSKRHFIHFIENFLSSRDTADNLIDRSVLALLGVQREEIESFGIVWRVLRHLSGRVAEGAEDKVWNIARYLTILAPALESSPRDAIDEDLTVEISVMVAASTKDTDDAIREVAVNCLGKLGFFNHSRKVWENIKPILLEVALNESEKLEIRSQALLSLCDLAMLSEEQLQLQQRPSDSSSFVHALETLIWSSNSSIVALVGEISMKLLLDARSTERKLLASLLAIYFDPDIEKNKATDFSEARAVGSSIRLHQLLSVFFPAFVLQSDLNRDTLVGSLHLALEYSSKIHSSNPSKKGAKFPMLKLTEYITAISDNDSGSVAISVCVQVAMFVSSASLSAVQSRAFCSFMLQQVMKAELDSHTNIRELTIKFEDLQMVVQDEAALESLSQVADRLSGLEASRMDHSTSTDGSEQLTTTYILVDSTNAAASSALKRYGRKTRSTT
ncbi:MAG: hypothetical protein SGBAC_012710 [Bacillariaceae sp.]